MALFHCVLLGVSGCLIYRYCCHDVPVDALGAAVLIMILMLFVDVLMIKDYAVTRTWIRCRFDEEGVHCSGFCMKPWIVRWDEICVYGVNGFDYCPIVFFSTESSEYNNVKTVLSINKKRIVFEYRDIFWQNASPFLPVDIKQRLEDYQRTKQKCFYRRRCK